IFVLIISKITPRKKTQARNAKRKILQNMLEKRKEKTPEGLQIKFYLIASLELAWRREEL
ncbi:hypothetical protein L9F63_008231, partial [Diploptera punctata]